MFERILPSRRLSFFLTLEANSGYCQIEVDPSDQEKTACTSHRGLYQFTCMPFSLENAPATFQHVMGIILSSVRSQLAHVYLDDVVILSQTPREHINHARLGLSSLYEARVTLRFKKCAFFTSKIDYFGHVTHPDGPEFANQATDTTHDLMIYKPNYGHSLFFVMYSACFFRNLPASRPQ